MIDFLLQNVPSTIVTFIIAMILLIKSADYFTESSEKIGNFFRIPQFIVGVTIVSIGTSLPELATSMVAIFKNSTEFVAGNVIGSNITNILLVVGASAIFAKKLKLSFDLTKIDLPLLMASAFLIYVLLMDSSFNAFEAIICIIGYIIYLIYTVKASKSSDNSGLSQGKLKFLTYFILIVSAIGIYFGAEFTVLSVKRLSELSGFADTSVLALSIVALGTSLPELSVSIVAALKKNYELSLGNVLGSNIFNSFIVLGIPGLFTTLTISSSVLSIGIPIMIAATILYFVSTLTKEISIYEGFIYVLFYITFIAKLFNWF
ncbi:calcium/sodium antiporter [Candidatus Woesearchaeota archaeon]|nr:calcium/sodium antiporter [Candidatus Woesearchaeota archaeon]